jgi:hypothetical protein
MGQNFCDDEYFLEMNWGMEGRTMMESDWLAGPGVVASLYILGWKSC